MTARTRSRAAAILLGLVAALVPMALLAYDTGMPVSGGRVIAQATGTAAPKAATPTTTAPTAAPKTTAAATPAAAPKTGNAGTLARTPGAGATAALIVVAIGTILGARVMASRRA